MFMQHTHAVLDLLSMEFAAKFEMPYTMGNVRLICPCWHAIFSDIAEG